MGDNSTAPKKARNERQAMSKGSLIIIQQKKMEIIEHKTLRQRRTKKGDQYQNVVKIHSNRKTRSKGENSNSNTTDERERWIRKGAIQTSQNIVRTCRMPIRCVVGDQY